MCGSHVRVSTELNSFRSHTYGASHVITQRARRERVCIYPETRLIKVYLIIIIPIHSFTLLSLYYVNYDFVITLLFIYLYTCMSFSLSIYIFKACILFSQYAILAVHHVIPSRDTMGDCLRCTIMHGRPTASLPARRRSRRSLLLRDRAAD